jgi:magnesium chelatase family protein
MAVVIKSIGLQGLNGYPVDVEVSVCSGVAATSIVGLGDAAIKEAKDRIEACMSLLDYNFPQKKIIINLSPSEIKKSGTYFDLAMIIGLLIESEQVIPESIELDTYIILGEISTTGSLRGFSGALPMLIEVKRRGYTKVIIPKACLAEAALVKGLEIYVFTTIYEVVGYLEKRNHVSPYKRVPLKTLSSTNVIDFADVKGHNEVIPYLTVAAAGNHNLLMVGAPGCGKSMIAKRLPSIMPEMTEEEILEVTSIYSAAGLLHNNTLMNYRPYRSPHYNVSTNALIGGGANAQPGEITLAHRGILFLDEFPEFSRRALEALRQPLEDKHITIARVKHTNCYPADFLLTAAMNPCPCGRQGSDSCQCTQFEIKRYRQRISGPILDRIDIQKYMGTIDFTNPNIEYETVTSRELKEQVEKARCIQTKRFINCPGISTNSGMETAHLKEYCDLNSESRQLMMRAFEKYQFSARSYDKILRLARTFADLEGELTIGKPHIIRGLMARDLDKEHQMQDL